MQFEVNKQRIIFLISEKLSKEIFYEFYVFFSQHKITNQHAIDLLTTPALENCQQFDHV